ncbi:dCMP deaminase family protein [Candidatus Woesearchaeota archaeon]|nr:dCMP deaminase family protein [Candidatus Woesearchaeota archaeon]
MKKLSWTEYFIEVARLVAKKSSCIKRQVGAVIVKDNMIISSGYNGTPRGVKNCNQGGCGRCNNPAIQSGANYHECLCVHAEENAIVQAAYQGIVTKGSVLFTSLCPCLYCAKSAVNAGIIKVFYNEAFAMDEATIRLFNEAGVDIEKYD